SAARRTRVTHAANASAVSVPRTWMSESGERGASMGFSSLWGVRGYRAPTDALTRGSTRAVVLDEPGSENAETMPSQSPKIRASSSRRMETARARAGFYGSRREAARRARPRPREWTGGVRAILPRTRAHSDSRQRGAIPLDGAPAREKRSWTTTRLGPPTLQAIRH